MNIKFFFFFQRNEHSGPCLILHTNDQVGLFVLFHLAQLALSFVITYIYVRVYTYNMHTYTTAPYNIIHIRHIIILYNGPASKSRVRGTCTFIITIIIIVKNVRGGRALVLSLFFFSPTPHVYLTPWRIALCLGAQCTIRMILFYSTLVYYLPLTMHLPLCRVHYNTNVRMIIIIYAWKRREDRR